MTNWANINYKYSPEGRRVSAVQASVQLLDQSGYADQFIKQKGSVTTWMQIDLWISPVPLSDSVTIFAGDITGVAQEFDGTQVRLTATDTFGGTDPEFPTGTSEFLTKQEFPDLPDESDGRAKRFFILNELQTLFPVTPISETGLEYYIAEPFLTPPPNKFFIGSRQIKDQNPQVILAETATSGVQYSKLVLQRRPQSSGQSGQVFVQGGSGPTTDNPISFFLDRIPKLKLTNRARMFVDRLNMSGDFDYYVVVGNSGSILDILVKRLLPQSKLVPFFRGGKLDIIEENGLTTQHYATLGANLDYRISASPLKTSIDTVFNAIDVSYRRHHQALPEGETFSRFAVLVDKNHGGSLGRMLSKSESIYGRKYLAINAADLGREMDAGRLGASIAELLAFPHNRYAYHVGYRNAFKFDINDRVLLTDDDLGLTEEPTRVTSMGFKPTGVTVTLQTTDNINE